MPPLHRQLLHAAPVNAPASVRPRSERPRRDGEPTPEPERTKERCLLEASLDALVIIGADAKIIEVNPAIEAITGRSRDELLGTSPAKYFADPERARAFYWDVQRDGVVRERPLELCHRDGAITNVLCSASLYRDGRGNVIGVLAAARPISSFAGAPAPTLADPRLQRLARIAVAIAGGLSLALGAWGIADWLIARDTPGRFLHAVSAGVSLPSAACFVTLGLALLALRERPDGVPNLPRVSALLAALTALLAVAGFVAVPLELEGSLRPPEPLAGFAFFCFALSTLTLDRTLRYSARFYSPAHLFAFLGGISSIVALLDFVIGGARAGASPYAAVGLFLIAFGLVCARPRQGLGALLTSSSLGGMLTRWLWPAAVVVPMLLGMVSWHAHTAQILSDWESLTVMIVSMIVLLGGLVVWNGYRVDRSDVLRRRMQETIRRHEQELVEAHRLARVGSWWWDLRTNVVTWSPELYRISGYDPKRTPPGPADQSRIYTPASRARLTAALEASRSTGSSFELMLVLVRADGAERDVIARGEADRDAGGQVVRLRGTLEDVTEQERARQALRESERNLKRAQQLAHVGSWSLDLERDRCEWSEEVYRIYGLPDRLPTRSEHLFASVHRADRQRVDEAWAQAREHGTRLDLEHRIVVDGDEEKVRWVRHMAEFERNDAGVLVRAVGAVQDITALALAHAELLEIHRAQRALSQCNQALIRASDEVMLLQQICEIIVEQTNCRLCWVGKAENDEARSVRPLARAGFDAGYLDGSLLSWAEGSESAEPTATCIRTASTVVINDISGDPRMMNRRAAALERGYGSCIAIALVLESNTFGALEIYADHGAAFGAEEVSLLSELAQDLAFGIITLRTREAHARAEAEVRALNTDLEERVLARTTELARAHEREADVGFRIQQTLLLDSPPSEIVGLSVAAKTRPSQRVDGDFYAFFSHHERVLDVIVGDVMGKGILAALLGAATKSHLLKALGDLASAPGKRSLPRPMDIVMLAHAGLARHLIDLDSFVTLCYARVDMAERRLDFVDCGHTGLLLLRRGEMSVLHGDNLPLGVREGEIYEQRSVQLEAGDTLLLFSDGITEARDASGQSYGLERLMELVQRNGSLSPEALLEEVGHSVGAFTGSARLFDDQTSVAVRVELAAAPLTHDEIQITSSLNELARARQFVRGFCDSMNGEGLDEARVREMELAVNEAVSNIMKHAYGCRPDQPIQVAGDAYPDRVEIRLRHLGSPFAPESAPPPSFNGTRESGFGSFIIKRTVDRVRYYRDASGRNCVALVKNKDKSLQEASRWS